MIHVTNLTKIYRSRHRSVCRALDKVNLTLPDAGLVFVLGKSGSGLLITQCQCGFYMLVKVAKIAGGVDFDTHFGVLL